MIYFGCVLIILLSGYVGKLFADKYVYRDKFYQCLISLCLYFKSNIGFSHTKLEDLFNSYIKDCGGFNQEIEFFKDVCLGRDMTNKKPCRIFKNINQEERITIISRLKQFGVNEEKFEIEKLDQFMNYCKQKQKEYSEQRKSMQPLSYKISLAIGVVFCILIL